MSRCGKCAFLRGECAFLHRCSDGEARVILVAPSGDVSCGVQVFS